MQASPILLFCSSSDEMYNHHLQRKDVLVVGCCEQLRVYFVFGRRQRCPWPAQPGRSGLTTGVLPLQQHSCPSTTTNSFDYIFQDFDKGTGSETTLDAQWMQAVMARLSTAEQRATDAEARISQLEGLPSLFSLLRLATRNRA